MVDFAKFFGTVLNVAAQVPVPDKVEPPEVVLAASPKPLHQDQEVIGHIATLLSFVNPIVQSGWIKDPYIRQSVGALTEIVNNFPVK